MGESNVIAQRHPSERYAKIPGVSVECDETARRLGNLYHLAR